MRRRSHRIENDCGAAACVDVIEVGDGLVVGADDALLPGPTSQRETSPWRHRCLTALLETSRRRKWLGILHASAVGARGRCVVFPGARGSGKSTLAAAPAAGAALVLPTTTRLRAGQLVRLAGAARPDRGSWLVAAILSRPPEARGASTCWPADPLPGAGRGAHGPPTAGCRSRLWYFRDQTGPGWSSPTRRQRRLRTCATPGRCSIGIPRCLRRPCNGSDRCRLTGSPMAISIAQRTGLCRSWAPRMRARGSHPLM